MKENIHPSDLTSKQTLASLYFPSSKPRSAVKHLLAWVKGCPPLTEELEKTGYNPRARFFTPKQLRIILHYLGEP